MTDQSIALADALAPVVKRLIDEAVAAAVAPLRAELAKAMQYRGTWQPGEAYETNSVVTLGGSMHLALTRTTERPGQSADWLLTVKSR